MSIAREAAGAVWTVEPLTRAMAERELPALAAADADTVGERWTAAHWLAELPEKWALSRLARAEDGSVAAFMIASLREGRIHIHRIAAAPARRGHGLGTLLIADAARSARALGVLEISLKVRRSNHRARALYERLHFQEAGAGANTLFMVARADRIPDAR